MKLTEIGEWSDAQTERPATGFLLHGEEGGTVNKYGEYE